MSEVHDPSQSSNPDVVALVAQNKTLARTVGILLTKVAALEFAYDSLPEQYLIPGPKGPETVTKAPFAQFEAEAAQDIGTVETVDLGEVGAYGAGASVDVEATLTPNQ